MRVTSREYKVIVEAGLFADAESGLREVRDDVDRLAATLDVGLEGKFDFDDAKERSILFLDTPDFTLRRHTLLLRQRVKKSGKTEYTLKCRTEDRYIAAGQDLRAAGGLLHESKFEEDVGVPFVSRFSRSTTIAVDEGSANAGANLPATLSAAARLFPGLLSLTRDRLSCPPQTPLTPVNDLQAFERVFKGPTLRLSAPTTTATLALILWQKAKKGRLLTAELSFRYEDEHEAFAPLVAVAARRFFEGLQRLDWARPDGLTKTQFMYGG